MVEKFMKFIEKNEISLVNFRFTGLFGEQKQVTKIFKDLDGKVLQNGAMIDGSSIKGWNCIKDSDILLKPDFSQFFAENFHQNSSVTVLCDVIDVNNGDFYSKDPRSIAKKSEEVAKKLGLANKIYCGCELEFFVFDRVSYSMENLHAFYKIECKEAEESSKNSDCNGYNAFRKGSYDAVSPQDSLYDLRSDILLHLHEIDDMNPSLHHHEVGNGQCEIGFKYDTLTRTADKVQIVKYIIKNTAILHDKTCTFMPKVFANDAGSGMHCHFSLFDDDGNLFHGNKYKNLSEIALFFIGGIAKHIRAICAFTNPTTNSYKRLRPGFEAPVVMSYSYKNRSSAIRIPYSDVNSKNETRIECRFPDPSENPYLCLSAILMAGIDGILNKISPGDPTDFDLYSADKEKLSKYEFLPTSLRDSIDALERDNEFLRREGVFSGHVLESYIDVKRKEMDKINSHVVPAEFAHYYNV